MKTPGYWYCDPCEDNTHSPVCPKCHQAATFKPVAAAVLPAPQPAGQPPVDVEPELPLQPAVIRAEPVVAKSWFQRMREQQANIL